MRNTGSLEGGWLAGCSWLSGAMPLRAHLLAYTAGFGVLAVLMAHPFIFGGFGFAYVDIGGDTFLQFYPLNFEFARQVAEGSGPTWSFRLGLGGYTGTHFDPYWILQGLLPESMQLQARIYTYLLKLGLGGLFFSLYMRLIGLSGILAVVAGLAYAFCDYAVINGQWDLLHATEVFHFGALVYLLERHCRSGGLFFPLLIGLLLGVAHPFNLYTSAFFSLAYLLARGFILRNGWSLRTWFTRLSWLWIGSVLGVLILAPLNLPNLIHFLDSPRVTGNHASLALVLDQIFSTNNFPTIFSTLVGFVGKGVQGIGNDYLGIGNFLEAPGFYVGLPALLLSAQLAGSRATTAEHRLFWIAVVGIALYVVFPAFRYAAFGFNHTAFRMSTLWISMLILVVGFFGFRRALQSGLSIGWLTLPVFGLGAAMVIARLFWPDLVDVDYVLSVVVFTAIYAIVLLSFRDGSRVLPISALVVAGIMLVEIVVLQRPALVDRMMVRSDGTSAMGTYEDGTREAVAWINERHEPGDFFRIEKDYKSVFLLDSLVQGYRGIRSYFFHGSGVTRFVDQIGWPRTLQHSNYIEADVRRSDVLDILSVRYLLSKWRGFDTHPGMRWLTTVNGIEVYERMSARSVAALHSTRIPEAAALQVAPQDRPALMLNSVIVDDAFESTAMETGVGDVIDVPVRIDGDTRLSGAFRAGRPSVLAFAVPLAPGWLLYLDGEGPPVELMRVNFGMMGAAVPTGNHTFELVYRPPGRVLGYWLAPLAAVMAWLLLGWQRRFRRYAPDDPDADRPT